jgi:hypothetical protein
MGALVVVALVVVADGRFEHRLPITGTCALSRIQRLLGL